jgi:hypothetical protein
MALNLLKKMALILLNQVVHYPLSTTARSLFLAKVCLSCWIGDSLLKAMERVLPTGITPSYADRKQPVAYRPFGAM